MLVVSLERFEPVEDSGGGRACRAGRGPRPGGGAVSDGPTPGPGGLTHRAEPGASDEGGDIAKNGPT